jgi:hypothetical protein
MLSIKNIGTTCITLLIKGENRKMMILTKSISQKKADYSQMTL